MGILILFIIHSISISICVVIERISFKWIQRFKYEFVIQKDYSTWYLLFYNDHIWYSLIEYMWAPNKYFHSYLNGNFIHIHIQMNICIRIISLHNNYFSFLNSKNSTNTNTNIYILFYIHLYLLTF